MNNEFYAVCERATELMHIAIINKDYGKAELAYFKTPDEAEEFLRNLELYKDGSRGKRHLIYNNKVEQDSFFEKNKAEIPLLLHEDWLAVRNDACFENEGQTIITHGGSHFMEMVIPFVKIERNP